MLPGDAPLCVPRRSPSSRPSTASQDAAATVLTAIVDDADGLGRVVRDKDGRVTRIVEHADATAEELEINEINTSIYCFRRGLLAPALRRLSPENAQGEYYLTDAIAVLRDAGHKVIALAADDPGEAIMVNDRAQLAEAEAELRARINRAWMRAGVTMVDPARTYIDATVELEPDVRLLPGTILEGRTVSAPARSSAPTRRLTDVVVGERARVERVARECEIGDDCESGRSRTCGPGTRLARAPRSARSSR